MAAAGRRRNPARCQMTAHRGSKDPRLRTARYNPLMSSLLRKWPLMRQLLDGGDGTGVEAMSDRTRALTMRTRGSETARSVCPYCAVGCGQLIHHRDGKLLAI